MKLSRQLVVAFAIWILQLLPAFADDVITNVMSSVVSYQYYDALGTDTNTQVISPVASYQYFDWLDAASVHFLNSPKASYYYQFPDAPVFNLAFTNRTPTTYETTPMTGFVQPVLSQLKTFEGNIFAPNPVFPFNTNRMTIVFTHGWNSGPDAWAKNMAELIADNVATAPNILAWDWSNASKSTPCLSWQADFVSAARQTPDQGSALGAALLAKLGTNYSQRIHFIGHSLGTLVNANAADYLHTNGLAPMNTQMTMFDEAEVATDLSCPEFIAAVLFNQWNPFAPKPYYYHPLPHYFAWADSYISAFGIPHPEVVNVILTNGFPADAAGVSDLYNKVVAFHGYPYEWYAGTVSTDVSEMGHRWSFERGGFAGAPTTNTVFLQSFNGSQWNLTPTNYAAGSNYLNGRFQKYRNAVSYAVAHSVPGTGQANGAVFGEMLAFGPATAFEFFVISLLTTPGASQSPQFRQFGRMHPNGAGGSENVGAYAWLPLPIPSDAVSMSFDFRINGDWQSDSLAAAFNGTNVLLLVGGQVETNVLLNSGPIDVTLYAGHTNEFFVGIVGNTSTNAQLTVQNVVFYTAMQPSLQVGAGGNGLKLTWPLTAQNFGLESTTNLASTNSWTAATNVPAVVDLQNTVTNSVSDGAKFFRLKK